MYAVKMKMPGQFNVGWRTVPVHYSTRQEAVAAAEALTQGRLAGWTVKVVKVNA